MEFVIVNLETERRYHSPYWYPKTYKSEGAAKGQCTRLNKKEGREIWVHMTPAEFTAKYDPLVPVYNHITGDGKTPIWIRKSEVGGCCDPSTERYHCM